jgi:hypothetical protein
MVESEFVLIGTEIDDSGIPWALLAREQNGEVEFAGPAILRPPGASQGRVGREIRCSVDRQAGAEGLEEGQ